MKKKKLASCIGLALGVTIFTCAAFANYNTANGYEVGKNAVKRLMENENYTMNSSFKLIFDGREVAGSEITELYDRDGDVRLNTFETLMGNGKEPSHVWERHFQDSDEICIYDRDEAIVYKDVSGFIRRGELDTMYGADEDDRKTVNKIIRFVELATDTFVGDLKNNIVYISGDDDSSTYEMNLDAVQIPELVNAGLSAIFSTVNTNDISTDADDPLKALGTDPIVKNVSLKFTVDNEGRFTDCIATFTMAGNGHECSVELSLNISDYGTTQPQRVDISTLPNVKIKE